MPKIENIEKGLPTHKFVLKNGILQKTEITKEDLKDHFS